MGPRSDLVTLPGEAGPNRKEQASSHPHEAVFDLSGRFIAVPDKALDRAFVFRLDAASGKLTPNDPPFVAVRAGAGPRHITFHPKMTLAYVINELVDRHHLSLRCAARPPAADPDRAFHPPSYTGNNTGAEIVVAPSGRIVYASRKRGTGVIIAGNRRDCSV